MIEAVAIGVSAGGMKALGMLLPELPETPSYAVIIVQHMREGTDNLLVDYLDRISPIRVMEAAEKEFIRPGCAYMAPPGYHLLVEEDRTFSLSADPPVSFARPSIDVLFESAADVFEENLVGIVLTGANSDGAEGLAHIEAGGGIAVVQDPATAESPAMPMAAIRATKVNRILTIAEIGTFLCGLHEPKKTFERASTRKGP
jgi:two-component system, chemotaxis family, protein-glutamate methylesterase/glutaminase